MKRFITRLLIFICLPLPFLFYLGFITDKGLHRSPQSLFTEWNDIYASRINADMLMMGSSRAWVNISPKIIDSTLHLNSYNLGIDGWPFKMQYARFKIYLQHNKKPRYIIQSMDLTTLFNRSGLYQYQQFLPYLYDSVIWNVTSQYDGRFNYLQRYFPLYKYNQNLRFVKDGTLAYLGKDRTQPVKYKGYQAQNTAWDSSFANFKHDNPNGTSVIIDSETCRQFEAYLSYCKNNNIQVIIVFPPQYYEVNKYWLNTKEVLGRYRNYAAQYNMQFIDYSSDSLCYSKKYFYNSQHLNALGSEIFSQKLAADIKSLLK